MLRTLVFAQKTTTETVSLVRIDEMHADRGGHAFVQNVAMSVWRYRGVWVFVKM